MINDALFLADARIPTTLDTLLGMGLVYGQLGNQRPLNAFSVDFAHA